MQAVLTLLIAIVFALLGLGVWCSSDRPLVLREIALNTRKEGSIGPDYAHLRVLSVVIKVFGALVWNVGLFLAILVNVVELPRLF